MDTNKTFVKDVKCNIFNHYAAEPITQWASAIHGPLRAHDKNELDWLQCDATVVRTGHVC